MASQDEKAPNEGETADIPVEVAGAFLTDFGTPKADAATVQAGFRPVGINLFESFTSKKSTEPVQVLKISYEFGGEIQTVVPLIVNNGTWHAVFEVPESLPDLIPGITVLLVIDESAPLQLISQTCTLYDAEGGANPRSTHYPNGKVTNLDRELLIAQDTPLGTSELTAGLLQFANYGMGGASSGDFVFTGTGKDGISGSTCSNWSGSSGTASAGNPASGSDWLSGSDVSCGSNHRLYCISSKEKRISE